MIVLDTTVLVYAVGFKHPLRDPCRALIEALDDGIVVATTTAEVLHKFAHIRASRWGGNDAVTLALSYADLLSPLLVVDEQHLRSGLRTYARRGQLTAADAVLAAATLAADATLVSADRAFTDLGQPRHEFPDAEGVARLLSAGTGR